tara:strand:+ start:8222 stop:10051 length:1830 start_codon:yes stop_codon:yes gene_type:complete
MGENKIVQLIDEGLKKIFEQGLEQAPPGAYDRPNQPSEPEGTEDSEIKIKTDTTPKGTVRTNLVRGKKWTGPQSDPHRKISRNKGARQVRRKDGVTTGKGDLHAYNPGAPERLMNVPWERTETTTSPTGKTKTVRGFQEPETTGHRTAEGLNKSQLKQMIEEQLEGLLQEQNIPIWQTKAYQEDPNISDLAKKGGGEAPTGRSDPLQAFSPWKNRGRASVAAAAGRAAQGRGGAGRGEEEVTVQAHGERGESRGGGPYKSRYVEKGSTTVGGRPHHSHTSKEGTDTPFSYEESGEYTTPQPKWAAVKAAERRAVAPGRTSGMSAEKRKKHGLGGAKHMTRNVAVEHDPETRRLAKLAGREGTAATVVPRGKVGRRVQSDAQRLKYGGRGSREHEGGQVYGIGSEVRSRAEEFSNTRDPKKDYFKSRSSGVNVQNTTPSLQFADPSREGTKRAMKTGGVDAYDPFQSVKQTGRGLSESQLNQMIEEGLQEILEEVGDKSVPDTLLRLPKIETPAEDYAALPGPDGNLSIKPKGGAWDVAKDVIRGVKDKFPIGITVGGKQLALNKRAKSDWTGGGPDFGASVAFKFGGDKGITLEQITQEEFTKMQRTIG